MLTRRKFISAMLSTGAALGLGRAPALSQPARKRLIVDSQIHVWKPESPDRPWVPGAKPQMPEPFTIEKALPLMDEAGVDRAIIVPPGWPNDRNEYALEAAKRYPGRFAVMGRIPVQNAKSADLLPRWKDQFGMLGARLLFNSPATLAWLKDGTIEWFWPLAEKLELPVMFLAPEQGPVFARIAERHPRLTLIIDHIGVTRDVARTGRVADAVRDALSLAKFANVSVKLSSIPLMSKESYPFRDMTEHLRRLFDAYGPRRCYWGTDITNSFARVTWRQRVTHFTETFDFLSEEDKDWVMGRAIIERLKWS